MYVSHHLAQKKPARSRVKKNDRLRGQCPSWITFVFIYFYFNSVNGPDPDPQSSQAAETTPGKPQAHAFQGFGGGLVAGDAAPLSDRKRAWRCQPRVFPGSWVSAQRSGYADRTLEYDNLEQNLHWRKPRDSQQKRSPSRRTRIRMPMPGRLVFCNPNRLPRVIDSSGEVIAVSSAATASRIIIGTRSALCITPVDHMTMRLFPKNHHPASWRKVSNSDSGPNSSQLEGGMALREFHVSGQGMAYGARRRLKRPNHMCPSEHTHDDVNVGD
jgi:hypothetical protein